MQLALPVTAPGEVEILAREGASEFYCGVQTKTWQDKFGDHDSISRRQGKANLASVEELKEINAEAASLGMPLFLTLNGSYTQEQLPYAMELAGIFEGFGGTGLMVMDIALLIALQKQNSRLIRGLSLLAAVGCASALEFYQALGVSRVVMPRFLAPKQMRVILRGFPHIQAEAIVWNDKCRFIDGYCRFIHSNGYMDCLHTAAGIPLPEIRAYDTSYQLPTCFDILGKPPRAPACAACHIERLSEAGVRIFKMGGRGRSLETRLKGLRFYISASKLDDPAARKKLYQKTFGGPCCGEVCYYN